LEFKGINLNVNMSKQSESIQSVYAAVQQSVVEFSSHAFLHIPAVCCEPYHDGAIDLSYEDLGRQVESVRKRYAEAGYGQGHRVALLLENRTEFFIHWFALNALGVSVVPINGEMAPNEMAYLLSHSESCLGVSIHSRLEKFQKAAESEGLALPIVSVDQPVPRAPCSAGNGTINKQTECALLYTSGSTGKPKACILNNEYYLASGYWYADLGGYCQLDPGKERLATPLPLVHMNAMACSTIAMIVTGGCIIQLDRFHPSSWWKTIVESRATIVHYLGVMPAILLNMDAKGDENFGSQIKFGFGAGVNPNHHAPFESRFGFPLIEGWAMTESGCAGAIMANKEPRHVGQCCFGKPPDNLETKLVDEQGNEVAAGDAGELLVRTVGDNPWKGFFSGYLKNAEANAETLADDWLHTGDVVRTGDDGSMYFVDRRKNVIRRSGENISALEVESVISASPCVEMVVVVPVPDEIRGDEVFAAIILKPEMQASQTLAEALFQHCYDKLVYYKAPAYLYFADSLPLTASGKPQRGELKTLARSWLASGDCFDLRDRKRRKAKTTS
jgi:acyl-CoA synthetase (AMP-forming)/AMP-acid ligase II